MRAVDSNVRDDLVLAMLLLLVGMPRVVLAIGYDRPVGVEGTLALICSALGLLIIARRLRRGGG